jgi:hypothetical protein
VLGGADTALHATQWTERLGGVAALVGGLLLALLDLLYLARPATIPREPTLTAEVRGWLLKRREAQESSSKCERSSNVRPTVTECAACVDVGRPSPGLTQTGESGDDTTDSSCLMAFAGTAVG